MNGFSRPTVLILALILAVLLGSCAKEPLVGTDLGAQPAPDFTLVDGASGERVSLSAQRGSVVLLTFLFTQCQETCPLTAEKVRVAMDQFSAAGRRASFLAVSVDPTHDTPQAIREFLEVHGLYGKLRYLIADKASLATVWRNYSVAVGPGDTGVAHLDAIMLIDKLGRARILLHSDADAAVMARDLKLLAAE